MQVTLDLPKLVGIVGGLLVIASLTVWHGAKQAQSLRQLADSAAVLNRQVDNLNHRSDSLHLALNQADSILKERAGVVVSQRDTARAHTDTTMDRLQRLMASCVDSSKALNQYVLDLKGNIVNERALADLALGLAIARADTIKGFAEKLMSLNAEYQVSLAQYSNLFSSALHQARPSRWGLGVGGGIDQQRRANLVAGVTWSILSPNVPYGLGAVAGVGADLKPAVLVGVTFTFKRFAQ